MLSFFASFFISLSFSYIHTLMLVQLLFMYHAFHTFSCAFLTCCLFGLKSRRVSLQHTQHALYFELHSLDLLLKGRIVSHVLLEIIVQHGFRFITCNYSTLVLSMLDRVCVRVQHIHVCMFTPCIYLYIYPRTGLTKQAGRLQHAPAAG